MAKKLEPFELRIVLILCFLLRRAGAPRRLYGRSSRASGFAQTGAVTSEGRSDFIFLADLVATMPCAVSRYDIVRRRPFAVTPTATSTARGRGAQLAGVGPRRTA